MQQLSSSQCVLQLQQSLIGLFQQTPLSHVSVVQTSLSSQSPFLEHCGGHGTGFGVVGDGVGLTVHFIVVIAVDGAAEPVVALVVGEAVGGDLAIVEVDAAYRNITLLHHNIQKKKR